MWQRLDTLGPKVLETLENLIVLNKTSGLFPTFDLRPKTGGGTKSWRRINLPLIFC